MELFVGSAGRLLVSGLGAIVIAALVGPSHKGTLATLAAVSWMVSVILGMGMDGTVRYYLATRDWTVQQTNTVIVGATSLTALIAFAGFKAFAILMPNSILADLTTTQLTIATATSLLGRLTGPALVAIRRFSFYAKLALVAAFVNPAAFLLLRLAGVSPLQSALWGYLSADIALALPGAFRLLAIAGWRFSRPTDLRGAVWYSLRSFGTNLFSMANLRLDVVLLRSLSTTAATGAYSLAAQFSEVVWLVPSSVGVASFPEIAEKGHDDGQWTARNSRLVTALSTLAAILAGAAASVLIVFFMPAYRSGLSALWLLMPGTIAVSISQILLHDLNARGLPEANTLGAAAALVVTIAGGLLLIPPFGLVGAAIVSSIAYSVNASVLAAYFVKTTSCPVRLLLPGFKDLWGAFALALRVVREFMGSKSSETTPSAPSDAARSCRMTPSSMRRRQFAFLRWSGLPLLMREIVQRRRVTIINYHEVGPQLLDRHLSILGARYNFITLEEYVAAMHDSTPRSLPPKSLVITIDDGHKSVTGLADVFRKHGVRPTVFLCSGLIDTTRRFWWTMVPDYSEVERLKDLSNAERLEALTSWGFSETQEYAERTSINCEEIASTRDVFDFQAHSVFHPMLTTCADECCQREIYESKTDLQQLCDLDVWAFAYPGGSYADREADYVRNAGYACAVTCDAGFNDLDTDPFRLRRVGMGAWEGACAETEHDHLLIDKNEIIARASGVPALLAQMVSERQ
ncbi:MAG: polysaccharide deacetylase family protein [Coriobacteriia bacterium]|jgi:O-antigen/teichoic acid export membrane protein/peptidoglycan/xylan/chitin deacetylase (PgdA/CDA1 family)|nr:polysaccharide deacetylase family protein [Coriobacteriia bacterium]